MFRPIVWTRLCVPVGGKEALHKSHSCPIFSFWAPFYWTLHKQATREYYSTYEDGACNHDIARFVRSYHVAECSARLLAKLELLVAPEQGGVKVTCMDVCVSAEAQAKPEKVAISPRARYGCNLGQNKPYMLLMGGPHSEACHVWLSFWWFSEIPDQGLTSVSIASSAVAQTAIICWRPLPLRQGGRMVRQSGVSCGGASCGGVLQPGLSAMLPFSGHSWAQGCYRR